MIAIDCVDCTTELLEVDKILVVVVLSEVAGSSASVAAVNVGRTSALFMVASL